VCPGKKTRATASFQSGAGHMRNCWLGIPRMAFFEDLRSDPRFNQHLMRVGHKDWDSHA